MIRVSTRGRYALRALLDVCVNSEQGPVSREAISERQGISAGYVAHLFRSLAQAGIVRSVRGPGGGYELGRDARTITAGDVLRATEGPIAVVHCVEPGPEAPCERAGTCVAQEVWRRLSGAMAQYLDSVTLEALRDKALRLEAATRDGDTVAGALGLDLAGPRVGQPQESA